MLKRMKGVAAAMESSPSPYATVFEDQRARLKHQSLLQDYEELYKVIACLSFQDLWFRVIFIRSGVVLDFLLRVVLIFLLVFYNLRFPMLVWFLGKNQKEGN